MRGAPRFIQHNKSSLYGLRDENLSFFNHIVPCGIQDKAVTSVEKELNRFVSIDEITPILLKELTELFGFEVIADK